MPRLEPDKPISGFPTIRDEILSLFARRQEAWRRRPPAADHTEDCTGILIRMGMLKAKPV